MLHGDHKGTWFVPGGRKYPGRLIIDDKTETITLEIFGREFIEGTIIDVWKTDPQDFHQVILGERTKITLYNCHWSGCTEIGNDLFKVTYRIEYAFTGVHFTDFTIPVRAGTFIFPHLSTWYDGDSFHDKLEGKQGLYVDDEHVVQNVLSKDEIKINNELTLCLYDEVDKHIDEIDISYKVVFSKYLRFQYETSVPFNRLLKDAVTFLKLLSFCFGKPMNFFITYVHAEKSEVSADPILSFTDNIKILPIHVNNYTLKGKKEIPSHAYHSRHMLLSRSTLNKEEMDQLIIKWFANEEFYNIYEYYLDSNNWFQGTDAVLSNVMFNNRFLNLIQGLEDYYREFFEISRTASDRQAFENKKSNVLKMITDKELKKWVNDTFKFTKYPTLEEKLTAVIADLSDDLSKLLNGISIGAFPQSAAFFRNSLSHGMSKQINQGKALHKLYHIARLLLGICILKTLGISNIKDRAAYYSKFEKAAMEIEFAERSDDEKK